MSEDVRVIVEAINTLRHVIQMGFLGLSLVVFGAGIIIATGGRRRQ